jgi:hypothetical protein
MGNENNGRWWEFNLVRYFIGTIVGTIILNFLVLKLLNSYLEEEILFKIRMLNEWHFMFVHLAFGLLFCYISSAPILVFHSIRLNFRSTIRLDFKNKFFYMIVGIILMVFCYISDCHTFNFNEKIALVFFFLIVFFQVYLMLTLINEKTARNYHLLTLKRDRAVSQKKASYIESYKHLREHS